MALSVANSMVTRAFCEKCGIEGSIFLYDRPTDPLRTELRECAPPGGAGYLSQFWDGERTGGQTVPRKEQLTITIDREIAKRLRKTAARRNVSLSSVIESYLKTVDRFAGKSDIQRVFELLADIKREIAARGGGDEQQTPSAETLVALLGEATVDPDDDFDDDDDDLDDVVART